ncbi:MAG: PAS domain S-box protein [Anaerolineae bacterium]
MSNLVRILVVDDDPEVLNDTARLLEKAGYAVDRAASGEDALQVVQQQRPGLLILDRNLPGIDGIEVCRRIKRDPVVMDILVVIVSGLHVGSEEQAEGLEAGADGYIARPITNRELLARVRAFARIINLTNSLAEEARKLQENVKNMSLQRLATLNLMEDVADERDRAEQAALALQASEEKYRLLIDNASESIVVLQEGMIKFINPMTLVMFGGDPAQEQELVNKPFTKFIYPEDRSKVVASFRRQVINGVLEPQYAFRIVTRDGTIRWVEIKVALIDWQGKPATLNFITDITERRLAEEALRDTQQRLGNIIEGANVGTWEYNVQTMEAKVNEIKARISGYTPDEVSGFSVATWAEMVHPDDLTLSILALQRHYLGEEPYYDLEYRTRHKDGHYIWANDRGRVTTRTPDGRPLMMFGTHTDITERRLAEEKIRRDEARLKALVGILQYRAKTSQEFLNEALQEAINITESKFGYVYFFNESTQEFILNSWSMDVMQECAVRDPHTHLSLDQTGFWGEAVRQRQPLILNDFPASHPQKKGYPEGHIKITRFLTIPVFGEGEIVAVVGVANKASDYDETDVLQLTLLMDTIWKSIDIQEAEGALRESEEKYRLLINNANEAIVVVQDGLFKFCNAATLNLLEGYSEHELQSIPYTEFVHPEDRENVEQYHCKHIAHELEQTRITYRVVTRGGAAKWVDVNTALIEWQGKPATLDFLTDITERKRAEDSVRESEAKFRSTIAQSLDGILIAEEDGSIVEWNAAQTVVYGNSREEMIGTPIWQFLMDHLPESMRVPEAFEQIVKVLRDYAQAPGSAFALVPFENEIQTKDGQSKMIELSMYPIRILDATLWGVISRDITQRKRAELALRESEAKFRATISQSMEGILIAEQDARIVEWNTAQTAIYGRSRKEMIGKPIWQFLQDHFPDSMKTQETPNQLSTLLRGFAESSLSAVAQPSREVAIQTKDGQDKIIELSVFPIKIQDATLWEVISRDITERKKVEEALAESAERENQTILNEQQRRLELERKAAQVLRAKAAELSRSNKELEQFAYVASHDLQEPLRMVASYTQLLAERYAGKLDAKADKYIGYAVNGAVRMQRLINDLLAYSRVGTRAKPFTETSCLEIVQESILDLGKAIEEARAEVIIGDLPTILVDRIQIKQVFQNLIANAIKFRGDVNPRVVITSEERDGYWELCVADNGIGIDPQFHNRIFIIFQRLHERDKYPGSGIGLAIVKKIIERHGGRIWIDSEEGKGARFIFTLPTTQQEYEEIE